MNSQVKRAINQMTQENLVYDVGSSHKYNKTMGEFKALFGDNYKTVDVNPRVNPDVVGNVQQLPLDNDSADGIICVSVLEHVENPVLAVQEIRRVLKPGKRCVVYVPCYHPYHSNAVYGDFWRFFKDGLESLFDDFHRLEIYRHGNMWAVLCRYLGLKTRMFDDKPAKNEVVLGYWIIAVK